MRHHRYAALIALAVAPAATSAQIAPALGQSTAPGPPAATVRNAKDILLSKLEARSDENDFTIYKLRERLRELLDVRRGGAPSPPTPLPPSVVESAPALVRPDRQSAEIRRLRDAVRQQDDLIGRLRQRIVALEARSAR